MAAQTCLARASFRHLVSRDPLHATEAPSRVGKSLILRGAEDGALLTKSKGRRDAIGRGRTRRRRRPKKCAADPSRLRPQCVKNRRPIAPSMPIMGP